MLIENSIKNTGLLKQLYPTLDQVVSIQEEAVSNWFDTKEELQQAEKDGDESPEFIDSLKSDLGVLEYTYTVPVNLSNCTLTQTKSTRIRLCEEGKEHIKGFFPEGHFSKETLRWNMFYFVAEVSQACGHVIVLDGTSGKTYTMLHADLFEVIPPQEC